MSQPFLTVLVPAYNEEAGLARNVELILAKLTELAVPSELLIVDDASRDRTAAVADELAARHETVRVVHHPVNQGIGGGMRTGIAEARGEWLILIPADLALDLDELRKYLDAAQDADVVVGIRSDRSDYSGFRLVVSWLNIGLIRLLFGMEQRQFNYISMYRLEVLRRVRVEYWRSAFFHAEILIKAKRLGYRLVEADIHYVLRASGRATGAQPRLIARTVRDMLAFWWRGSATR
ncbi:MAG: glycosyltransferase family 2 protein [Chloroflexi bacterium]|nr:glycosyltransferase family 2 protein [Chloroflexota bacterium]